MANAGPGEWYASLPPVSKFWFASCALSTIGPPDSWTRDRWRLGRAREEWQVWRVVTNFVFIGKFSLGFAMRLVMIAQYAVSLEDRRLREDGTAILSRLLFGSAC